MALGLGVGWTFQDFVGSLFYSINFTIYDFAVIFWFACLLMGLAWCIFAPQRFQFRAPTKALSYWLIGLITLMGSAFILANFSVFAPLGINMHAPQLAIFYPVALILILSIFIYRHSLPNDYLSSFVELVCTFAFSSIAIMAAESIAIAGTGALPMIHFYSVLSCTLLALAVVRLLYGLGTSREPLNYPFFQSLSSAVGWLHFSWKRLSSFAVFSGFKYFYRPTNSIGVVYFYLFLRFTGASVVELSLFLFAFNPPDGGDTRLLLFIRPAI